VAEDLDALFVGPIMNDVAEEVGVGSGGNAFEKAAFDDAAALGQARGLQLLLRPPDDVAQVEQDPLHVGIACEHGGEERAVPSADIGQDIYAGEIVSVQHGGGFINIQGGHAVFEDRTHFRVRPNVVENGCAENFVETGLASLHGVMQAVPGGK